MFCVTHHKVIRHVDGYLSHLPPVSLIPIQAPDHRSLRQRSRRRDGIRGRRIHVEVSHVFAEHMVPKSQTGWLGE